MKSTLLIKKELAEAIMAANDFQSHYNAFSGVDIKMRRDSMELDPWLPCRKPCRFLQERIFESPAAGIPAGMEQKCTNPVYGSIEQLKGLLASAATTIAAEQRVFDGVTHENSYKLSRERIYNLVELIDKMREICHEASKEGRHPNQHHYFTKEKSDEG
jgi:hypothetical protein